MTARYLVAACTVAALAGVAGSCAEPAGRQAPDGPLAAEVGSGGNSLDPPPGGARWTGTFGGIQLCVPDGDRAVIESVSYHAVVRPVAVRALIRQVPPVSERRGPPRKWAPIGARVGTISELEGAEYRSAVLQEPHRAVVTTPCGEDPDAARAELVTSITTDRQGGWVDEATIIYSSGGREYQLEIPWTYVTCGRAVADEWFCRRDSG